MKGDKHLALRIMCPSCDAAIGRPCLKKNGEVRRAYHQDRHDYLRRSSPAAGEKSIRSTAAMPNKDWAKIRAQVFALKGSECTYCNAPAWHVDHKMPRCRGGNDEIDNLVPACGECNRKKGGLTYEEFVG